MKNKELQNGNTKNGEKFYKLFMKKNIKIQIKLCKIKNFSKEIFEVCENCT